MAAIEILVRNSKGEPAGRLVFEEGVVLWFRGTTVDDPDETDVDDFIQFLETEWEDYAQILKQEYK